MLSGPLRYCKGHGLAGPRKHGTRREAEDILGLMARLNKDFGKTIIMVTHDPRAAEKAHCVRHLEKGVLSDVPS